MVRGIVGSFIDIRCPEGRHARTMNLTITWTDCALGLVEPVQASSFIYPIASEEPPEIEDHTVELLMHKYPGERRAHRLRHHAPGPSAW